MSNKEIIVIFGDIKLKRSFDILKEGKYEDKKLHKQIDDAMTKLKLSPELGIKIPNQLWPDKYVEQYKINNLWKCDLSDRMRIVYTIKTTDTNIAVLILEWFDHKEYERRFNY